MIPRDEHQMGVCNGHSGCKHSYGGNDSLFLDCSQHEHDFWVASMGRKGLNLTPDLRRAQHDGYDGMMERHYQGAIAGLDDAFSHVPTIAS